MAKFFGDIYFTETQETAPGVWKSILTKRKYYGDVVRNSKRFTQGNRLMTI